MKVDYVSTIINTLTFVFHLLFCWLFVYLLAMKVEGIGYASLISSFTGLLIMVLYSRFMEQIRDAIFLPNLESVSGLFDYVKISMMMIFMLLIFVLA